jgi:glutaredoxin
MELVELVEFIKPLDNQFTVYSKSGCPNCKRVKELLEATDNTFTIIDCDEYLLNSKSEFLYFIEELSSREWKTFPIVFKGTQFIGGFTDTKEYFFNLF